MRSWCATTISREKSHRSTFPLPLPFIYQPLHGLRCKSGVRHHPNPIALTTVSLFSWWKIEKTIIPFAHVGYVINYNQLGVTHLPGYLSSRIQRALME